MKPWEIVARARIGDGAELTLARHDSEYVIRAEGQSLMSSRMHGSEDMLAALALTRVRTLERPCVLVGGLGMGFTLRAALDALPRHASLVVAELLPAVIEWNRGPLGPLAADPLHDPRVRVEEGDVAVTLRANPGRFDAVLLDVDNGPAALTAGDNAALYGDEGLADARAALRAEGVLAVWSARADRAFEQRLRRAGFSVQVERVRGRLQHAGPHHVIFIGRAVPQQLARPSRRRI